MDCIAVGLCGSASGAALLLCKFAKEAPDAMRAWLLGGISPLCAELFTEFLEGWTPPDDGPSDAFPLDEHRLEWIIYPEEEYVLQSIDVATEHGECTRDAFNFVPQMSFINALGRIFEHVYSLVASRDLACVLMAKKDFLRRQAWQHAAKNENLILDSYNRMIAEELNESTLGPPPTAL
jgi:hypothetical protein